MKTKQLILALGLLTFSIAGSGCDTLVDTIWMSQIEGSWSEVNNNLSDDNRINLYMRISKDKWEVISVSPDNSVSCDSSEILDYDGETLKTKGNEGEVPVPLKLNNNKLELGGVFVFSRSDFAPAC